MKHSDPSLDRLLRAAGGYRPAAVAEAPPFGFTARVIAGWLAGGSARESIALEVLWFRRAFLCAIALMALSVGWSFKTDIAPPNDEAAIASYDAGVDLP